MNDEKNNQVELKDGKFTIKIKVDGTLKDKNNLKVLYILNKVYGRSKYYTVD